MKLHELKNALDTPAPPRKAPEFLIYMPPSGTPVECPDGFDIVQAGAAASRIAARHPGATVEDYRPVKWPPPGPYWCTGYGVDKNYAPAYATVVAYVSNLTQLLEFWPEAKDVSFERREAIVFTDRFARPEWWPEGKTTIDQATP